MICLECKCTVLSVDCTVFVLYQITASHTWSASDVPVSPPCLPRFASCSALQGLLRKLGAGGFEELLPGGISGGRLKVCRHNILSMPV